MCGIVCVYIYIMYMHVLHEASMKKHRHVVNEDESSGSSIHSRAPISIAQRIPGRSEKNSISAKLSMLQSMQFRESWEASSASQFLLKETRKPQMRSEPRQRTSPILKGNASPSGVVEFHVQTRDVRLFESPDALSQINTEQIKDTASHTRGKCQDLMNWHNKMSCKLPTACMLWALAAPLRASGLKQTSPCNLAALQA